jgi:hypothetical protein
MKRFWNRGAGGDDLEVELRANRPEPRPEFVQAVTRRVQADGRRPSPGRSRTAFASALSALTLLALAAGGGLGYAASAVRTVVNQVERVASPTSSPTTTSQSPSQTQYKPGKGCGDQNHLHDRNYQCKVTMSDASVTEGNSGTKAMVFTVSLSDFPLSTVTAVYSTANGTATGGTAATAGIDYLATAGTLTFGLGQISQTITVLVLGDTVPEPNETLFVNLTSVSDNAYIGDGQGMGTIFNDDGRVP